MPRIIIANSDNSSSRPWVVDIVGITEEKTNLGSTIAMRNIAIATDRAVITRADVPEVAMFVTLSRMKEIELPET